MADYALIIGIEHYIADGLPAVQFAEADAKDIAEALTKLGFVVDTLLLNNHATKTIVEHKIHALLETLTKKDRFFFYFAGHGFAVPGHTILSCSDTIKRDIDGTGIRLSWIMELLDESECFKAMFFLDACHVGAVNLRDERGVIDEMSEEEVKKFFDSAEHKVCFAACKFSQSSLSTKTLKHGIWTYHLLKALGGEERKALTNGRYLTARSLQDYLYATVPLAAKAARSDQPKQTPVMYGSLTNDFQIADLTPLLAERQAASPVNPDYKDAVYKVWESISVTSLTGFRKGSHTVPREVASYAEDFIQRIAKTDIEERVNERFVEIRDSLGLKRRDIRVEDDRIITKDFEYSIWCEQDREDAGQAVIFEQLSGVSPTVIGDPDFDDLFDGAFREMVLSPKKKIDVGSLIDAIEELDSPEVKVEYDSDCDHCTISFRGTRTEFLVTATSVTVRVGTQTNPTGLITAFANSRNKMIELAGPSVRLLS